MIGKFTKTNRGFQVRGFKDRYNQKCSIQQSSIATENCIWLGINDANPQIMVYDAIKLGLPTNGETCGWIPYKVPEEVLMTTKMHLDETQVKNLIETLQHWLNTGSLNDS